MEKNKEINAETVNLSADRKYPCTYEGCTAVFSKNSKLQYHIRRHTGERPFACDEPNCTKSYFWSFHLRRHKETHSKTVPNEKITCPHEGCYFQLANKYSLKKHIKRKHDTERDYPFSCDVCQQGFFKKRQLLYHSYVHTGVYPIKCDICDARFPHIHEKNRHMRITHTKYPCICGKIYQRWSELLQHKKVCNKIEHSCELCELKFKKAAYLQNHLKLHYSDGSERFHCGYEDCKRVYLHKKNLTYHINVYHIKKPKRQVYCNYCNRGFSKKQNLIQHIENVHTKVKPTVKKTRNIRKDKGIRRTDIAASLAGLDVCIKTSTKMCKNQKTNITSEIPEERSACL